MVSSETPEPSRAGPLTLVGGELALRFRQHLSGRGWPTHKEHLRSARDVVDWAAHARVLPPADADWLRGAMREDAAIAQKLLRSALDLREDVYVLGSELAAGRPAPPQRVESLTRIHAHCLSRAHLAPFEGNFVWTWAPRKTPVEAVLGPISLSALTTAATGRPVAHQAMPGRKVRMVVLRRDKEQEPPLVRDGSLRQPRQAEAFGARARGA